MLTSADPEAGDVERLQRGQPQEAETNRQGDPERHQRERERGVGREPGHACHGVLRLSAEPRRLDVGQDDRPESDPGDHPAQEAMILAHLAQRLEDRPGHQPIIGRAGGDLRVADDAQEPVEGRRGPALEARERGGDPLGEHDVEARPVQCHHVGNQLGRMLPIAVERDHRIAVGSIETGREGRLVAEVAAQLQDRHVGVARGQLRQLVGGVVDGAIVHVADPDVVLASQRRDRIHQPPVERGHHLLLVVERNDDVDREPARLSRHGRSRRRRPAAARAGGLAIRRRTSGAR